MITIQFETENAAFGESDHDTLREACYILHTAAEDVMQEAQIQNDDGCTLTKLIRPIRDSNGNTIGSLTYTKDLFSDETTNTLG